MKYLFNITFSNFDDFSSEPGKSFKVVGEHLGQCLDKIKEKHKDFPYSLENYIISVSREEYNDLEIL